MALTVPENSAILSIPAAESVSNAAMRTRGTLVGVDEAEVNRFMTDVQNLATDATTYRCAALRWNTMVTQLWSDAEIAADPERYIAPGVVRPTTPEVRFLLRASDTAMRAAAAATARQREDVTAYRQAPGVTPTGVPVVGAQLVVCPEMRADLDPALTTITADESYRRTMVLALWETVRQAGERATIIAAPPREASGWWLAGAAAVLVGGGIFAICYTQTAEVEIQAQLARDMRTLELAAEAYQARLQEWRRTGTMPPAGEIETGAQQLVTQRANDGVQRLATAASEVLRQSAGGIATGLKWAAALALGWKLLDMGKEG